MFQLPLLTFLAAAILMPVHAQNDYLPPFFEDPNRIKKMQECFPKIAKMVQEYAEKNHILGYAFGIMVDGKMLYFGSGGYSNLKEKIPASPQTLFRIASMTKSFTAMAILKLRDEGKLSLDDRVDVYIPELKDPGLTQDAPPMTIRNLLTHSAGFPEDNAWGDRQLDMQQKEFIAFLKKGLSFANVPNSTFEYSNLGYALLGMIIDKVSGISYQDYIAQFIWQPLNMTHAAWEFTKVPPEQLAQGYSWKNGNWHHEPMLSDGVFGAMGGMIASLESMGHYVALFQQSWPSHNALEHGPIKRSSLREMQKAWQFNQFNTENQFLDGTPCPRVEAYGYGLRWFHDCEKKTYVGHSGGLPGFGSNWFILPEYGIGAIFLANNTYAPAAEINFQILHTLVKEAKLQPRKFPVSSVLSQRQEGLVKLLPDWNHVKTSGLFADNFFLDAAVEERRKESQGLFNKAGKIIGINPLVAEDQLRGYFIIKGEKADLKIRIALSPEKPALIQEYQIEEVNN